MGLGGIVAAGLDGKVRVGVFVCMREVRLWRGIQRKKEQGPVKSPAPIR